MSSRKKAKTKVRLDIHRPSKIALARQKVRHNEYSNHMTTPQETAYSAIDVAKYFIYLASKTTIGDNEEKEGITNLKLQKILYLAQAYFLVKVGKPLFEDTIEAWEYGPVVPAVYRKYRRKGSDPIFLKSDVDSISTEDKETLQKVWDSFGGYSASKLVAITHAHDPWKDAYSSENSEITNEAISNFYAPLLNK